MREIVQSLARHIEAVAGRVPKLQPVPEAIHKLPAYFGGLYEAWQADLFEHRYLFLVSKGKEHSTPAEVSGHYRVAMREIHDRVAFVFLNLEAFARQRLVQYRVPFVVPGRQVYLPQTLIDLREGASARTGQSSEEITYLSGAAQAILLCLLQKPKAPELLSLREWSAVLGYSAMTATRAASELAATQLCRIEPRGRKTLLNFDDKRRELWEKALPFLRTPVRGRSYVRLKTKGELPWLQAGLPALSRHTMLADDGRPVFAIGTSEYTKLVTERRVQAIPFWEEDAVSVERWRYRPGVLSGGPTVDRLSLYLSLYTERDERVQAALKELVEGIPW
jgi:hypothetical protein